MVTILFGQNLVFWSGALVGLSFIMTAGLGIYSNFVNPEFFQLHKKSTMITIPLFLIHASLALAMYWFGILI